MPSEAFASLEFAFLLYFENPWRCTCTCIVCTCTYILFMYIIFHRSICLDQSLEGEVELRIRTSPDNLNEEITPFVCMDLGLVVNWRDSSCLSREN